MEAEMVGGLFDSLIQNLLKMIKPDLSKLDKAKLKSGVSLCLDSLKPTITLPGDIDDKILDTAKDAINAVIDKIGVEQVGPITVGDADVSLSEVESYLSQFPTASEEVREKLKKRPRTVKLLKERFTEEQQAKIVGNPFLITLLTIFGPMIVEWIIKFLSK